MAGLINLPGGPKGLPTPEDLDFWIRQFKLHFFGKSNAHPPFFKGVSHQGCLGVLDLGLENLSRFSLHVPKDRLLVVLGSKGEFSWPEYTGSQSHPDHRHQGVLLPGDRLMVPVHSNEANLLLLSCSLTKLRGVALAHGLGNPDWSSLPTALPNQHSLIHLCCSRLLALAIQPLTPMASALVNSLEVLLQNSLVSLAGSESCSLNADNPAHFHVAHAVSFMKEHLDRSLSIEEISIACHVSVRTLQNAFKSVCHLTPIQTLQELRLDGLRARLQMGEDVASACRAVGLKPTGRTAAAYRDRYGELPRDTRIQYQLMPADSQVKLAEVRQLFSPDAKPI